VNSTFLPTAPSGTVRLSNVSGGKVSLRNPGDVATGTESELVLSSSYGVRKVVKFMLSGYQSPASVFYHRFTIKFPSAGTKGQFYFVSGNGSSFTSGSDINKKQAFAALRWRPASTGNLVSISYLRNKKWTALPSPAPVFLKNMHYEIQIYGNNSSHQATYRRDGTTFTLQSGMYDLWVMNKRYTLAKGGLSPNSAIDSFMGIDCGTRSRQETILDDFVYSSQLNSADDARPILQSFNMIDPGTWRLVFSKHIAGLDSDEITLQTSGEITSATLTSVIPVGTTGDTFDVGVNTGSGDGTLRLVIPPTALINDLAGNTWDYTALNTSQAFVRDDNPPKGSIMINGGATRTPSTAVTLNLSASDAVSLAAEIQMRFSNNGTTWSSWQPFAESRSWTLPSGDASKTVYVQYKDSAGHVSATYSSSIILDTQNLLATITSGSASFFKTPYFTARVSFSFAVSDFTASDVNASNGSISNFVGSGKTYSFQVTPLAQGLVTLQIPADAAHTSTKSNLASDPLYRTYDSIRPSSALASLVSAATNQPFDVNATFSENVTGFLPTDLALVNATVSAFAGSGNTYRFTVEPVTDGPVSVMVPEKVAMDVATNQNSASNKISTTFISNAPSVDLTSEVGPYCRGPFSVECEIDQDVTGFGDSSDFVLVNATISNVVQVDPAYYTFDVTPVGQGPLSVAIAANACQGLAGAGNISSNTISTVYDNVAPSVLSITPAIIKNNVAFTVKFSEPVTNFNDLADIGVNYTGTVNSSGVEFSGSGDTYVVTVRNIGGTGQVSLSVRRISDIADLAGNLMQRAFTSSAVSIDGWRQTAARDWVLYR